MFAGQTELRNGWRSKVERLEAFETMMKMSLEQSEAEKIKSLIALYKEYGLLD